MSNDRRPRIDEVVPKLIPIRDRLERDGAHWRATTTLPAEQLRLRLLQLAAGEESPRKGRSPMAFSPPIDHRQPSGARDRSRWIFGVSAAIVVVLLLITVSLARFASQTTAPTATATLPPGTQHRLLGPCPATDCAAAALTMQLVLQARLHDGLALSNAAVHAAVVVTPTGSMIQVVIVTPPTMARDLLRPYLVPGQLALLDTHGLPLRVGTSIPTNTYPVLFTNADFDPAAAHPLATQANQRQLIGIQLAMRTGEAQRRFADYTQTHIGGYLTFTLDEVVLESAVIQSQITGTFNVTSDNLTNDLAQRIVLFLKDGVLPISLQFSDPSTATTPLPNTTPKPGVGYASLFVGNQIVVTNDGGAHWMGQPTPNMG